MAQPSGEICVNTLKKDWNPAKWSLGNILQTIRCLLISPYPESALNEEAARLFMESYDEYFTQARIMTSVHAAKKDLYKAEESAHVTETGVLGLSQVPNAKQE